MIEYIPAKTIVTRTKSTEWFGTDYNMNIYKGCCHGCIYCDSRSECYHIDNFEKVRVKQDALHIIRDDLRRKVKKGVINTGAMSDPYNPLEEELCLTRHALELIDAYEFGVSIATKGPLIARDVDVLSSIREHSPVICKITITAADDGLSAKVEPRAAVSSKRFETLARLRDYGIFAGILLMPVLPFIEDNEENVRAIIEKASECGCRFIYPAFGMTLRQNQRDYYYEMLNRIFPGENLVGKYRKRYGECYECRSPQAARLYRMLGEECEKRGILYKMKDITHAYKKNYGDNQLNFLDMI